MGNLGRAVTLNIECVNSSEKKPNILQSGKNQEFIAGLTEV